MLEERDLSIPLISTVYWRKFIVQEKIRRARRTLLISNSESAQRKELEKCRRDVQYFIENWCWILAPHEKKAKDKHVPFVLWPEQVECLNRIVESLDESKDLMIVKGRELGITWLCLSIFLYYWMFEDHFLCTVGSRKEDLVIKGGTLDSLFGKIKYQLERLPGWMVPGSWEAPSSTSLLKNPHTNGEILGESTNADFARGGRRNAILIDEFGAIETSRQDEIMVAS